MNVYVYVDMYACVPVYTMEWYTNGMEYFILFSLEYFRA